MLVVMGGCAAVLAAGACCATRTRWRARVLAVLMAMACMPFLTIEWRMLVGPLLVLAAMLLSVRVHALPSAERVIDIHRGLGAIAMAGMVLTGGHGPDAATDVVAHHHGGGMPVHLIVASAAVAYAGWTIVLLVRRLRGRPMLLGRRRLAPMDIELAAMSVMFVLFIVAMLLG